MPISRRNSPGLKPGRTAAAILTSPLRYHVSNDRCFGQKSCFLVQQTFCLATAATKHLFPDVPCLDLGNCRYGGIQVGCMSVICPSLTSSTAAFTAPQSLWPMIRISFGKPGNLQARFDTAKDIGN